MPLNKILNKKFDNVSNFFKQFNHTQIKIPEALYFSPDF